MKAASHVDAQTESHLADALPEVAPSARVLAREVRGARTLSAGLKRHWLQVLPHLREDDRRRLAAILREP